MTSLIGPTQKMVIFDLDNTLYDWVHFFVNSFYAMVDEAVDILGCDKERLLDDLKEVHQRHRDSETPFALLDTEIVRRALPNASRAERKRVLDSAFHEFNKKRKESLNLHYGVYNGLEKLSNEDFRIVAYTESNLFAAVDRLTRTGIIKFFDRIYCRERSKSLHPDAQSKKKWELCIPEERIVEISESKKKPDPGLLMEICQDERVVQKHVAYVGDSVARDMMMAKMADIFCVWAKYGTIHNSGEFEKLVRVSHWTDRDVQREIELQERAKNVDPDAIAETAFSQVIDSIENRFANLTDLKN